MEAIWSTILDFLQSMGFAQLFTGENWKCVIMIAVACVLLYLAIVKKFEPLLLVPIGFGMLLTNLPGAGLYHAELFAGGHVDWQSSATPQTPVSWTICTSALSSASIRA